MERRDSFPYEIDDIVLVHWRDTRLYYAKIRSIDWRRKTSEIVFEDMSKDVIRFDKVHAGEFQTIRTQEQCNLAIASFIDP